MGLFTAPVWKTADGSDEKKLNKAKAYLEKVIQKNNREELLAIASQAPDAGLRKTALRNLKNYSGAEEYVRRCIRENRQDALAEIALNIGDDALRKAAIRSIPERQQVLAEAALQDRSAEVRRAAVCILTDRTALMTAASRDSSAEVRLDALRRIDDEAFLAAYALKINSTELAQCCVSRIKTPETLAAIAVGTKSPALISACLQRLPKPPSPELIRLLDTSSGQVIADYLAPYRDESERNRIALTGKSRDVRTSVIRTLTDGEILYRVATEDESRGCRDAACQRLRALRPELPQDWWETHIDEKTTDQRLALRLRNAEEYPEFLPKLYEQLKGVYRSCSQLQSYIIARCPMALIRYLEEKLTAGDTEAEKILLHLYKCSALNPALAEHAAAQKGRFRKEHISRRVDSSVCGEVFRHEDYYRDTGLTPLD